MSEIMNEIYCLQDKNYIPSAKKIASKKALEKKILEKKLIDQVFSNKFCGNYKITSKL